MEVTRGARAEVTRSTPATATRCILVEATHDAKVEAVESQCGAMVPHGADRCCAAAETRKFLLAAAALFPLPFPLLYLGFWEASSTPSCI